MWRVTDSGSSTTFLFFFFHLYLTQCSSPVKTSLFSLSSSESSRGSRRYTLSTTAILGTSAVCLTFVTQSIFKSRPLEFAMRGSGWRLMCSGCTHQGTHHVSGAIIVYKLIVMRCYTFTIAKSSLHFHNSSPFKSSTSAISSTFVVFLHLSSIF